MAKANIKLKKVCVRTAKDKSIKVNQWKNHHCHYLGGHAQDKSQVNQGVLKQVNRLGDKMAHQVGELDKSLKNINIKRKSKMSNDKRSSCVWRISIPRSNQSKKQKMRFFLHGKRNETCTTSDTFDFSYNSNICHVNCQKHCQGVK